MDSELSGWVITLAITAGVIAFARWRQRLAVQNGTADTPAKPRFSIPDEMDLGNARLLLTTWDPAQRSFAESILLAAHIEFTAVERSYEISYRMGGGPCTQLIAVREEQAAEARAILRESLAQIAKRSAIHSARS